MPSGPSGPSRLGSSSGTAFSSTIALRANKTIFVRRYLGRRTIFTIGLAWLSLGMLLIGVLSVIADRGHEGARWGQAGQPPHLHIPLSSENVGTRRYDARLGLLL
jgi:hypothetical protein